MELSHKTIYENLDRIIRGNTIDLSECTFIHPWAVVYLCLLMIDKHNYPDKRIVMPTKIETRDYLKRIHFDETLELLKYYKESNELKQLTMNERDNPNVQELLYCQYRDYLNACLNNFIRMYENFGLDEDQARLVVALIGELGNNVFDHNSGNWPTDIAGCFITAQNYPKKKCLELVIGDPGIGFLGSLKSNYPDLEEDIPAIRLGLSGKTGRINERRGNGLKFIQKWTLDRFDGSMLIHSGNGLVTVDKCGINDRIASKISGTIIQIMLNYIR